MRFQALSELRLLRKRKGVYLYDLQAATGVHRTTIGRWERGIDYPNLAALEDVCNALGAQLRITIELMEGKHERLAEPNAAQAPADVLYCRCGLGDAKVCPLAADIRRARRLYREVGEDEFIRLTKITKDDEPS